MTRSTLTRTRTEPPAAWATALASRLTDNSNERTDMWDEIKFRGLQVIVITLALTAGGLFMTSALMLLGGL